MFLQWRELSHQAEAIAVADKDTATTASEELPALLNRKYSTSQQINSTVSNGSTHMRVAAFLLFDLNITSMNDLATQR